MFHAHRLRNISISRSSIHFYDYLMAYRNYECFINSIDLFAALYMRKTGGDPWDAPNMSVKYEARGAVTRCGRCLLVKRSLCV